jgi:hypothetical protein
MLVSPYFLLRQAHLAWHIWKNVPWVAGHSYHLPLYDMLAQAVRVLAFSTGSFTRIKADNSGWAAVLLT